MANDINASSQAGWVEQELTAKLDYTQNWSSLLAQGETIATSVWESSGVGVAVSNESIGSDYATAWFEFSSIGRYRVTNTITTSAGRRDSRTFLISVIDSRSTASSGLFTRDDFVAKFRTDILASVARFVPSTLSDDYIWDKLLSAEADAQRQLHVFFAPTVLFPEPPSQAEIDALAGKPYAIDPGYDCDSDLTQPGGWSFVVLRNRPVVSLESVTFSYPSMGRVFTVPSQWTKLDRKYGHLRFIPTSNAFTTPIGGMMVGAMGMQNAPQFIEVRYTAGLTNAAADFPDLLDVVKSMTLLRILGAAAISASESVSADGLSQSVSAPDLDKMQDGIDRKLDTLRQRIHGVSMMVL